MARIALCGALVAGVSKQRTPRIPKKHRVHNRSTNVLMDFALQRSPVDDFESLIFSFFFGECVVLVEGNFKE